METHCPTLSSDKCHLALILILKFIFKFKLCFYLVVDIYIDCLIVCKIYIVQSIINLLALTSIYTKPNHKKNLISILK